MSAAEIAQEFLADNFGKRAEDLDIRQVLERAAQSGIWEGERNEREKVCLCPDFMTRDEFPHLYDYCPFYCKNCNYDTHGCRGCGDELAHDDKEHNCQ